MQNNYDPIARYYDRLSRMVFFRAQVKAQTDQLRFIRKNSKILIAGGGTGWILEEIARKHAAGLEITYVEISEKMLELSKRREVKQNTVVFIHAAAEDFQTTESYDVVITAFLFDNFGTAQAEFLFSRFDQLLSPDGLWLFADFYYTAAAGKFWQKILLKLMYFFFKAVSNIQAGELFDTTGCFRLRSYQVVQSAFYYRRFIKAIVYRKPGVLPQIII